jgi:hypothetical protein
MWSDDLKTLSLCLSISIDLKELKHVDMVIALLIDEFWFPFKHCVSDKDGASCEQHSRAPAAARHAARVGSSL